MVASIIGGPGIALPLPTFNLGNTPVGGTNLFSLPAGEVFIIPAGTWMVNKGSYSFVQFLDPVSGLWRTWNNNHDNLIYVESDGTNFRVANLSGCPTGAIVTNVGSGYTAGPPTVTSSAGGSTWVAFVDSCVSSVTIASGGSGYTLPPILQFSAPPPGGISGNPVYGAVGALPATAYCVLTSGVVTSVVLVDQGFGYVTAPTVTVVPNPYDPNLANIVPAKFTAVLGAAGEVTAVVCTYNGTPLTSVPTLTFTAGVGSGAAATVDSDLVITGVTVGTAGAGLSGTNAQIMTVGGYNTATPGAVVNPSAALGIYVRPANIYAPISGGALGTPVVGDGGMFQEVPTGVVVQEASSSAVTTTPVVTFTVGGVADTIGLQPL